jgi:GNAT superfamily N-acetyltransferase
MVYDRLTQELSRRKVETLWANARDDQPQHLRFLQKRGFRELWRNVTQRLAVQSAELSGLEDGASDTGQAGIVITTLAEESQHNPNCLRELHELQNLIHADVPRAGYFTPVSYDDFASEFSRGTQLPDGYFIAKHRGKYIGLSYLQATDGDPPCAEVGLTGVRSEHRRQGVGLALKLRTIKYAREHGYEAIETGSDTTNEAILALNDRVGFQKTYAWVTFEKTGRVARS